MKKIISLLERIASALETIACCEIREHGPLTAESKPNGEKSTRYELKAHGKRISHVMPKPPVQVVSLDGVKLPKKDTVGHCWYIRTLGVSMHEMSVARKALGIANLGTSNNPRHKTYAIPAVVAEINRRRAMA